MLISSRRNPLVNRIKSLHEAVGRRATDSILLEGTHLFQEIVRLGLVPNEIVATPQWIQTNNNLIINLPKNNLLKLVTIEVLRAISTTKQPDGVIAILPKGQLPLGPIIPNFLLVLDHLQDPGNLGTLMRTALAAGVDYVWLLEGADPWQPKVLRASAGATLALPLKRFLEKKLLLQNLQILKGMQRVATRVNKHEVTPFIQPYWQLNWCKPTILFLGNEGSGLDPGLEAVCTDAVTIPHTSLVESLNVGVAAAPLLLERIRQKLTCGD